MNISTYLGDPEFCRVIPILLIEEGGYVNNPSDPGGATNFGISQRSYPTLNISQLTANDAANIYFTDYWVKNKCDAIAFPLNAFYFDTCVNQGPTAATTILQQTIGVTVDGVLGPLTLTAAARYPRTQYYNYLLHRLAHYQTLKGWGTFGKGWTNRLLTLAASLV